MSKEPPMIEQCSAEPSDRLSHRYRMGFCARNRLRASFGRRCEECEVGLGSRFGVQWLSVANLQK